MSYTVGGLFSGVGGIEYGFEKTGKFKVVWANEFDPHACITYRYNHDHLLIEKDIRDLKTSEIEPVDVLTAGFPCQAFSIAGYRKGFEDDRGNVFYEIMRLVDELQKKPKVLFLENVKNLKSHDGGNTFKKIKDQIVQRGYSFNFAVLNTSEITRIPQNRERTYMICFRDEADWMNKERAIRDFQGFSSWKFDKMFPPKSISEKLHVQDILEEKKVDERYYYRKDWMHYDKLLKNVTSENTAYQWRRVYVRENQSNEFPTLTANMGTGGHNVPIVKDKWGIRKLTPKECFRLQGYNDIKLPKQRGLAQFYKQAGNMVTVDVVEILAELVFKALDYKYSVELETA